MSFTDSFPVENVESNGEVIAKRIEEIEDSLTRESWLPMSLRGLLALELPQVLSSVRSGGRLWQRRVAKQLLVLSLATWVYGPSPLYSETISRVQALELEVNGSTESKREGYS